MTRMKQLSIAVGAMLATMALAPVALANPTTPSNHGTATQAWRNLDANHDGHVTRSEADAYNKVVFAQADRNNDGRISENEFAYAQSHSGLTPLVQGGNPASEMWATFDRNADGEITQREFTKFWTRMMARTDDPDRPGTVSKPEFMSAWNALDTGRHNTQAVAQLWNNIDADNNGRVTSSEAETFAHRLFARMDQNGDGKVSNTEYFATLQNQDITNWMVGSIAKQGGSQI